MKLELELYRSLVYRDRKDLLSYIEDLASQAEISNCFLVLSYAVFGKVDRASEITMGLSGKDQQSYLCREAEVLIVNAKHGHSESIPLALQLIEDYPSAAFARYLLASNAIRVKNAAKAYEYYESLYQDYPDHPRIPLLVAETLVYLGNYSDAMRYVRECKPSLEQRLYKSIIPLSLPWFRLIVLGFALVSFIIAAGCRVGNSLFLVATSVLFVGMGLSLFRSRGTLIFSRFLYLQILIIVSWLLGSWIWSLMQGS